MCEYDCSFYEYECTGYWDEELEVCWAGISECNECGFCLNENSNEFDCDDLNQDTGINIVDVILLVNIILDGEGQYSNCNNFGNINNDSGIDIVDIIELINIILYGITR